MAAEMSVSLQGFSLKAFLRSPLPLFLLAGLYPAVLLLSRNWFIYTAGEAWLLMIGTSAASMLPGFLLLAAGKRAAGLPAWKRLSSRLPGAGRAAGDGLCVLYACLVCFFLLQATIFIRYDPMWLKAAMYLFVAGFLVLMVAVTGLQTLTVMLAVMIVMAGFGWVGSWQRARKNLPVNWNTADRERVERLAFARKPNVYLIHLESYQSQEAMRELYGFDNAEFLGEIERIGFTIVPNYFANYPWTLLSMSSMFAMRHHYLLIAMGNDDAIGARRLIGGKDYNATLQAFRNNGYASQIVFPTDHNFDPDGSWDYFYPGRNFVKVFGIYQSALLDRVIAAVQARRSGVRDYDALLAARIAAAADSRKPFFSIFGSTGMGHAPTEKTWRELAYWREEYPRMVRKANPGFLRLVREIVQRDPGAVIILFGDHGANRYKDVWYGARELNSILAKNGVTGRMLAYDLYGVMLAVRYPVGDATRFAGTSHVNLLRVLLAGLSGDDEFLSTAVENESYIRKPLELFVAARDGKPLDTWEKVER